MKMAIKTETDASKYLPELMAEKDSIDSSFVHAVRLITKGKALCELWLLNKQGLTQDLRGILYNSQAHGRSEDHGFGPYFVFRSYVM